MRCVWVISISPDIIKFIGLRTEIMTFFVYAIECIRRFLWNFFRIEYEHIKNLKNFKAVEDIHLPF